MRKIDLKQLKRIPVEEVPTSKWTKWDDVFSSIPEGEALVVPNESAHPVSIREAIRRRKKKGKYLNYSVVMSGKNSYIVHSSTPKVRKDGE